MNLRKLRSDHALLYRLMRRAAWPLIIFGVLSAVLSVYYSFKYLEFSTSRSDLVASDQQLIRLSRELEKEFGERDDFVVVVEKEQPERAIAFAEALAAEVRQHPQHFPEIFYRVNPEPFKKWALLYLNQEDLIRLKAKLLENRRTIGAIAKDPSLTRFFQVVNQEITRAMIGELFTSFLKEEEDKEPIPDLSLLNGVLRQLNRRLAGEPGYVSPLTSILPGDFGDFSQEGYFFTENKKYLLFLVTSQKDGFSNIFNNLQLLRKLVHRVKKRFPDIKVGVTGPAALSADELSGAMADINLASWLSLFAQTLIMIIFFWSIKRPLVQGLVLLLGLCWTLGLATLVVGQLNILSIVFAPLMLGITVDFGIHWYSRLEEELGGRTQCTEAVFSRTMVGATPGNLYAALAAIFSILPLIFTGFKGLAELGLIVTMGIATMIFGSLILLPALALVTEKCRPSLEEEGEPAPTQPRPFLSLSWRHPGRIVALGVVVTALGGLALWYVPFDLNPLHLQNQKTESVVWELKILEGARYSSSYGTMVAVNLKELPAKVKALKQLPTVSHCESILSFLPEEIPAKRRLIRELKPVVASIKFADQPAAPTDPKELANILGRIHVKLSEAGESDWRPESKVTQAQLDEANLLLSQVLARLRSASDPGLAARIASFETRFFDDLRDKWDLLKVNAETTSVPGIQDLPAQVRERFISPRGRYLIRVFPSIDIWETEPLGRFVNDLRSVDPNVVGDPVLLYHFNFAFKNACLWAAGMALLAIVALLWLLLRSLKLTFLALMPLWVGTALTVILMWIFGLSFNQANVLFLPLILGEGIEYGIIILVRWQLEESARAITLPASTAKGIALASLTTAFGFGSMMISGHRGTFSLGLLSTVGSLSCLLAALSVLPAFLRLLERQSAVPQPAANHFDGLKRWLNQIIKRETL
ncbi:MAG: MMPL family transporter [Deltaproteobacteria bacterium]|nr:MMPL family transporter [Deltaproteobacteria bacterium]